jgi:hypothetical protein
MNPTDHPTDHPTRSGPGCATAPQPTTPPRRHKRRAAHHHAGAPATPQHERLRSAALVLAQERAPGADYYPSDDEIIGAWAAAKDAAGDGHSAWPAQLDRFLAAYLDQVRDLMLRARGGRAPARLLDELASAVAGQLARCGG